MKLWKVINGEPYMINDARLGILGLNPKKGKRKMAHRRKHRGAAYMAWVRSFQRKRNPWPVAGTVMNYRRRHYRRHKRNPSLKGIQRSLTKNLPPIKSVGYSLLGWAGSAFANGFLAPMVPASWTVNSDGTPNLLTKYAVVGASVIGTTWLAKSALGPKGALFAGIGGGMYALSLAAHDFFPGRIPGMSGPLNLAAYTQLRSYESLRAPNWGGRNTVITASDGGMAVVPARFRRFQ